MREAGMMDLYFEIWLRERDSGELQWTTKSGSTIPIKDMTLSHLKNSLAMLQRYEDDKMEVANLLDMIL